MFDQQLTMDGRAEDIAPKHVQPKLFVAPKTMRGQLALDTDYSIGTSSAAHARSRWAWFEIGAFMAPADTGKMHGPSTHPR